MADQFSVHGMITALVTPFTQRGDVDEDSLREIVQFQLKSGVHGLFVNGTTGMGTVMMPEQRKRVAEIAVEEAKGRIPSIIHVGAVDPSVGLDLAVHAEKTGADAIASVTPFYYQPGEEATLEHYRRLSEATKLPIFVYNIPRNTGNNVDARLLSKLCKIPRVVGIKDSSRDFSQLLDFLQVIPDGFNVVNGTDSYQFSAFCAGVKAGVSATANVIPELFVEMYNAYKTNNLEKGKALQFKIHAARTLLSKPAIAPLLEALKLRGLRSGFVKPPLRSMTTTEIANLRESFTRTLPEIKQVRA